MAKRLILICACVPFFAFGQIKRIDPGSDTTYSYPQSFVQAKKAKLTDLKKSELKSHYRFWKTGQIIEIWTEDGFSYHGTLLNYIYKYQKMSKKNGVILQNEMIDTAKAKDVIDIFKFLAISKIPSQNKITDWKTGMDGETITIEYSTPDVYSIKSYWEPDEQTAPQSININKWYIQLKAILNLRKEYQNFEKNLRVGKYSIGIWAIHKYPTPQKRKGGSYLFN